MISNSLIKGTIKYEKKNSNHQIELFLKFSYFLLQRREGRQSPHLDHGMAFWRPGAAGPGVEAERVSDMEVRRE